MWLTLFGGWMVKGWQENRKCFWFLIQYTCAGSRFWSMASGTNVAARFLFTLWVAFSQHLLGDCCFPHSLSIFFFFLFLFFLIFFLFFFLFPIYCRLLYLSLSLSVPFLSLSSFLFNVWMTSGTLGCCYYAWCTKLSTTHLCCWLLAWENCSNSISWQYHMEYSV